MSRKPIELSVKELFSKEEYIIPLYQRNYAWEESQVVQLIQDIWDNATESKKNNYYIGTLVVHRRTDENDRIYETIDGQQRLTTLNILLSVLKNEYGATVDDGYELRLKFDSRKVSSDTLKILCAKGRKHGREAINPMMEQAYLDMDKKLGQLLHNKKIGISDFSNYLLNHVKLLQVEVPARTELNHYFEIMNNRGEQLEKHEILKATLLEPLKHDKEGTATLALIWEACSSMDMYMHLGFAPKHRDKLFNEGGIIPNSFESLCAILSISENERGEAHQISFLDLLNDETIKIKEVSAEENLAENIRFSTIITFPNFLLHVLRVYTRRNVALDDKRLIKIFEEEIRESGISPVEFVREFALTLFKCRSLYDRYIIKRETTQNGDSWSLKSIKKSDKSLYFVNTFPDEDKNKQVVMLLSMFHVSFPQLIYKHWLSGALNFLFLQEKEIDADSYITYLEALSDAFYYDRIREKELDYYDIVFDNNGKAVNNYIEQEFLHRGTKVQNFIFNRLDYLIWRSIVVKEEKYFNIASVNRFEFSFRSSVEHYYPQNPKTGMELKILEPGIVDHFGNLCLISRSKNSELSNYSPKAKAEHYEKLSIVESLKQQLMMQQKDSWDQTGIIKHEVFMIALLNG